MNHDRRPCFHPADESAMHAVMSRDTQRGLIWEGGCLTDQATSSHPACTDGSLTPTSPALTLPRHATGVRRSSVGRSNPLFQPPPATTYTYSPIPTPAGAASVRPRLTRRLDQRQPSMSRTPSL